PKEVKPGDKISIGDWAFTLGAPPEPEEEEGHVGDDEVGPAEEGATMMKSVEEMEALRAKALQRRPSGPAAAIKKATPAPAAAATGDDDEDDGDRTTESRV